MNEQFELFFVQRFKGRVLFEVPMRDYTSLKIGGPAEVMAFPTDEADLRELIKFAASKRFPVYFLGGGTNLLVRDGGVRGIVVNLSEGLKDIEWPGGAKVTAGAGVQLPRLVSEAAEKGLAGLEFASGIPGTVGGAVRMNAGAYGGEMKDVVEGIETIDKKGKKGFIPASEVGFDYRSSSLPVGTVVTRVRLKLSEDSAASVKQRIKEVKEKRADKGKFGKPNAGCVFKNPEAISAGQLIEELGLKGERSGGAEISSMHANYIVNNDGASARDVLSLMAVIRDRAFRERGVILEPEIEVIGED